MPSKTRTSAKGGGRRRRPPRGRAKAKAIAKNPFAALLTAIRRDIDARLSGFFDAKLEAAKVHGPGVVEMVAALRDLCLRGGKRARPALLVAGYRAVSTGASLEPALDAGVALELLHAYFLVHDDWMDHDDTRRGGPSVHAALAKKLRSRERGDASAILAGDYAVAVATEALARVEMAPARTSAVFACFAQMQIDAVIGQELDLLANAADIERVYELKTGSYTVRGPLRMGALLAGANPRVLTALDRFALPVGVAYQLRDDLLSAFGDPTTTGKPRGSDLTSGKNTILLATALKKARGRDHRILRQVAGNPHASQSDVKQAIEVLERSGARAAVEARIEELVSSALLALRAGRLSQTGITLLEGAARVLTLRRS
jgi:geranylgeranyl diphosphate synthase, type I